MTATKQQLFDGSTTAALAPQTLDAGPLRVLYDQGTIRHIRYGGIPAVHQIYAAIRDHNWGTIAGEISSHQLEINERAFSIAYDMHHRADDINFTWHATIVGQEDGTITFTFDGHANSDFLRNRIGFCVLHPMTLAGQACVVEHVDGSQETGAFPDLISPHQPFFDIRTITHEVSPGVRLRVQMDGDSFEMEDQRNWTDASYKTYCTPLGLPFPVQVRSGEQISQQVTISLLGSAEVAVVLEDDRLKINPTEATTPLCDIGLGLPSHGELPDASERRRLQALNLTHVRGDVRLYQPDAEAQLQYVVDYAAAVGTALELALFVSDNADTELAQLYSRLSAHDTTLARIAVFHHHEKSTRRQWVDLARQHLAQFAVPIGAGTDSFFTELNRERPPVDSLDFVIYSVNPQVHAFDNLSLTETLAGHSPTIETARSFSDGKAVIVSPVTLKMRWNPNATGDAAATSVGELPPQVDPRQMSLFGGGWTLGSMKYCAECGAQSATYYETTGWRGVMETAAGSPQPDKFPSEAGTVFPMYLVFAAVGDFAGGEVVVSHSSDPLRIETLWLRKEDRTRIILANLSAEVESVEITGIADQVQCRILDEDNILQMMHDPESFWEVPATQQAEWDRLTLMLKPYATAVLDLLEQS